MTSLPRNPQTVDCSLLEREDKEVGKEKSRRGDGSNENGMG
jgi:hypothetical protein